MGNTTRLAAAALLAALYCSGLGAARAEDGLQRFEHEVKPQFELKKLTYAGASALGDKGFVLKDVVAIVPGNDATQGKESTVKIEKVTVEEIDFERLKKEASKDDIPRFAKIKIEGMTGDEALSGMLEPYGISKAPVDIVLDYRLDPATKILTISKIELGLRDQAKLAVSLIVEGVSDKTSEAMKGGKDDARLRTAVLMLDDAGLLAKLLPAVAKQQNAPVEALIAQAIAPIAASATTQGPDTLKQLDAIVSFIGDWKKPQGPIKITMAPTRTASINDLDKIGQPDALTSIFGLTVDYPGTRAGAAKPSGGDKVASSAPASGGNDTTTGAEAWMSIIGNTLTGKIDGEVIFEHYRKDGSLSLLEGDEITKGRWSLEGEKVCFKYPDEDKDCQTLSRTGDEVTFMRDKKKGYRLKLLQGNPKNL